MAYFLSLLGVLSIIGGLIGCFILWPNSSELLPGYTYKTTAYIPSIMSIISGIISSVIFFALSKIITLLDWSQSQFNFIENDLRKIREKVKAVE